ncbi:hypothetical protein DUNSADRAFT_16811 [Dunaliella salina]|uniref:Uncharacterized protein n=1 Tax=Dunaliella salina TaxID=3046 RepID=A0ABQ7G2U2_DUNSA|nr:hypothetical protein DUNSADRAFT_16811 [Dunaliella salina]|eukprot:KAF5828932.1 hypothetical protein DUNSADRAFT_16811 [Dunaliella salina]
MINAVRKEEMEAEISRGRCVQGGSRDLGYTGKLKGGGDGSDGSKIVLSAKMLHGGLKRCSSECGLSSKRVGASCRWGDCQRFRCLSSASGSSYRASTDTSTRVSTETSSASKDPQIGQLKKDSEMALPPDQAEEIPDADSSDEFSGSGLQLEEQLPSSPCFLLETGVEVCPPMDVSPSSFNDLPPPSPLRRFSLDTQELKGSKFQEVNRRSSMGSVAICGQLLAVRGFHSVDHVLPKQPAEACLSRSLYKQAQPPLRPSTRIPGSTRVTQSAQPPSAVQHPSLTPTGRSLMPPISQIGRHSPASAAAPSGASTSGAGSEASTGSSKPRGKWLRRSSPAGGSEHGRGAGQPSSSVGPRGFESNVEQQPRQEPQPARAAGEEQQGVVQQAPEGKVPASSSPSQHQVNQKALERTVLAGAQGEQQGSERRAPAGAPDQQQGLERSEAGPREISPASLRALQARQQLLKKHQQELGRQQEHEQEQQQERQQQTMTSHALVPISAPVSAPFTPATPSAAMPAIPIPATPYGAPMDARAELLLPRPCDPAVVLSKAQEPLPQVSKSSLSLQDQHHPTAGALAASMRSLIYASSPSLVASTYSAHFGALSADLGFCLEAADHCNAARAVAAATGDPMPVCLSSIDSQIEWTTKGGPPVALRGTDAGLVVATLKDLDALLSSQGMVACRALLSFAAEQMQDPVE